MTAHLTTISRSKKQKLFASLAVFEQWLSKQKSDYNYEFVSGIAIKKPAMKQNEISIVQFLTRTFATTAAYRAYGELRVCFEIWFQIFARFISKKASWKKVSSARVVFS